MTDQLREALKIWHLFDHDGHEDESALLVAAARVWLEFPTPEAVEAAARAFNGTYRDVETGEMIQSPWEGDIEDIRAALEAARNITFGKDSDGD